MQMNSQLSVKAAFKQPKYWPILWRIWKDMDYSIFGFYPYIIFMFFLTAILWGLTLITIYFTYLNFMDYLHGRF